MDNNLFEINDLKNITKNNFCYEMNNFYKHPDKVNNFLNTVRPYVHKWEEKNSLNTVDFLDCRHEFISLDFKKTESKLYKFLKKNSTKAEGLITTNFTKILNTKINLKNYYWWPHVDSNKYNCIIYLNKKPCDGTNIYTQLEKNEGTEHSNPWQKKNKYKLLQNIKSKYNKLVIFKSDLTHGLAYNEHKFNDSFRKNQVIFIH